MKHLQNTRHVEEKPLSGEVITLPPVQVRRRAPALARKVNALLQRIIPAFLGLGLLVVLWQLAAISSKGFPTPLSTLDSALTLFADPFYRDGPNDMGIGWNVLASLQRVAVGFGLAALAGIPLGFLIGRFTFISRMFTPLIALLRPVSPRWRGCLSDCCCSRKRSLPPAGPFLSALSGRWSLTPPRAYAEFRRTTSTLPAYCSFPSGPSCAKFCSRRYYLPC